MARRRKKTEDEIWDQSVRIWEQGVRDSDWYRGMDDDWTDQEKYDLSDEALDTDGRGYKDRFLRNYSWWLDKSLTPRDANINKRRYQASEVAQNMVYRLREENALRSRTNSILKGRITG